jgi:8-oxo-dGTP pyrophosphatase MutT (NUDIX family)
MICAKESKREVATLIPYVEKDGAFEFFLQKRSITMERLPGFFAFFGGGLEKGETKEQGMLREIKEELDFVPEGFEFFSRYENVHYINSVFALKVEEGFENTVTVHEGDYGEFFPIHKIEKAPDIIPQDKMILDHLNKHLSGVEE